MDRWSARGEVTALIVFGLALLVVAALLATIAVDSDDTAGARVMIIGAGATGLIGQVLVFIGVVAIGVRLGARD